jgi:hypothetical protein
MLSLALNAVGFVACGMVWNAARVFHGRKPNLPGLVLGAIAWIATIMTLAPEASAMRMTIGAAIVAIYAALTARNCGPSAAGRCKALADDRGAGAARFRADAADPARRSPAPA